MGAAVCFYWDCFYLDHYTAEVSSTMNQAATNLDKSNSLLIFKSTCATQVENSVLGFQMVAARPQAYLLHGHNILHLPKWKEFKNSLPGRVSTKQWVISFLEKPQERTLACPVLVVSTWWVDRRFQCCQGKLEDSECKNDSTYAPAGHQQKSCFLVLLKFWSPDLKLLPAQVYLSG